MYTSYIGKKFLKLYNERNNTDYTARRFFDEVFFEIFFRDESHLMHVGNSPFFQKPKEEDVRKRGGKSLAQLHNLHENIKNDEPNMSIFVGYAAKDLQGNTSGQLTTMDFKINDEEMYASWFGAALGIGVEGGLVMLIDEPEILWFLYEGWTQYRNFLNQTPGLKDKQIETWNGHWLCHRLSRNFDTSEPWRGFNIRIENVLGKNAIPTKEWVKVISALSHKYPNRVFTAYCYNLSQTNTTLGFINIYLPQVRTLFELRDAIFIDGSSVGLEDNEIEELETFFTFKNACKAGVIGLKALEPNKLRSYMPKGSTDYAQGKEFKFDDEKSYKNFQLFKLWIIAMLNKTELLKLAADLAAVLIAHETKDRSQSRGKTLEANEVNQVREAKNKKSFIEALIPILEKAPEKAEELHQTMEQVVKMPTDNFPLFSTLVRFEYQYQKHKSKSNQLKLLES